MKCAYLACAVAGAITASASATIVSWTDVELGAGSGSLSQSFSNAGFTLNASVTGGDGIFGNITSGTFTGLWLGMQTSSAGIYTFDMSGVLINSFEFEFDAMSNSNGPQPEVLQAFGTSNATGTIVVIPQFGVVVTGSGLAGTVITSTANDGQAIVTISSTTPFTSISFLHTQDPNQNGFVIERVTVDVVPAPGAAALMGLAGLVAVRRRR